ncbi:hypothetical protein DFP72DRAFT_811701 [Ephemerocybe angulata]|uniref:PARP catalytic domain-containing protein n=1 Tax=Ephemerocybe angulata TaxID=980116 RepID=A0A8H6HYV2_9AGAR|nr:hypothetical protein DFP72DRAFT_811701 [Tulosesus angulatus]
MSSMASHIPMALSFLSSVASGLQASGLGTHKQPQNSSAPSSHSAPAPPAPLQNSTNLPTPGSSSASTYAAQASGGAAGSASSTIVSTATMCIQCHTKPRYSDGTKTHPYCSKTCAIKIKANSGVKTGSGNANSGNCDFCHNRPKFNDGTKTHDFCSKACARNANPQRKQSSATSGTSGQSQCQAPGCTNPPHPSSDYCSLAHKTMSENLCLMCLQAPKMANSHFCSQTCIDDAEKKGPMILEVPVGHSTFKSVGDQFKASWRHAGSTCPAVRRVYKIIMPPGKLASYEAYRTAVEAKGQFVAQGRSAGNENRRWHGTRRTCNLGDKGHTQFCGTTTCSLCSIIRNSFDITLWGKKTGWGRFGKGIYTSSTSSKSNDYSHNDCKSNLKAILLNKVIVGKGCKMLQDNTSLTSAPAGFDSVLAEKGGSLNYDELVIYNNEAIRPSFLVVYDEP